MANNKSDKFKEDAVRIALTSGLTRREVSADLLLENEKLRRVSRVLKEEREVLKKATVSRVFAGLAVTHAGSFGRVLTSLWVGAD